MISPLEFFRLGNVTRILERAWRSAGTPLSVHYVERAQEGARIVGWGGCAACRHVAQLPEGRRACRVSRQEAASMAMRQNRPFPFVCHMGFACVSTPLPAAPGFIMTLGPFCPSEESRSLEHDALSGLAKLGESADRFPTSLADIHLAPAAAIPHLAAWTVDALQDAWAAAQSGPALPAVDAASEPVAPTPSPTKRRAAQRKVNPATTTNIPYNAAEITAALAGGNRAQARMLLRGVLQESSQNRRTRLHQARARVVAAVSTALEMAAKAGLETAGAWAAYPAMVAQAQAATGEDGLLDAAMTVLTVVRRTAAPRNRPRTTYAELNAIVAERLEEGITLGEVAAMLGKEPSSITRRLQRNFGMNYSEYVGRLRIAKAKTMLRNTRLSATAIGYRVGISDQSNFGKLFQKFEGMSPLAYRRLYGKKPK